MTKSGFSRRFTIIFSCLLLFKLLLAALFSSAYQDTLFIPFVSQFLSGHFNPWEWVYQNNLPIEFPYFPAMLLFLSPFYELYLGLTQIVGPSTLLQNLLFKAPSILADVSVFYLLLKWFPKKPWKILGLYFASPILMYAVYMHGQLDLIPMALLVGALYALTLKKWPVAGLCLGLALATKLHVIVALPLILLYLYRKESLKTILIFLLPAVAIPILLALPFISSIGFQTMVLANHKQMMVYDSFYKIGSLKLYLPIFFVGLLYAKFFTYPKVNRDLLFSFLGVALAVFVFLVQASPGWHVWLVPFVCLFLIKFDKEAQPFIPLYWVWIGLYLVYFICFYIPDFQDLIGPAGPIWLKYGGDEKLGNILFTGLEITLIGLIYGMYRIGIKSNSLYKNGLATLIGIGGDSGVGKSTLKTMIKQVLGESVVDIEGDGDHKWERGDLRWTKLTHLNPKANKLHQQLDHLVGLKSWKPVYRSDYNHHTGKFDPPCKIMPKDYVILSGLHPFYLPNMRRLIDIKIYLDTDEKLRQHWKIIRDQKERGYSTEKVLAQIESRKEDAHKYIYPQKLFADLVIKFFSDTEYALGDASVTPEIKLQLTFDAGIHIEDLLDSHINPLCTWDYAQDLKTQTIIFEGAIPSENLGELANQFIPNLEDLVPCPISWTEGYYGTIQLFLLLVLAKKLTRSGDTYGL